MRNFISSGNSIPLVAPYAVASGAGMLVGAIFAVALAPAAQGEPVEGRITGVVDLKAKGADTITQGQAVYWDDAAKEVTETVSTNKLIGAAIKEKGAGATVCRVLLNGTA